MSPQDRVTPSALPFVLTGMLALAMLVGGLTLWGLRATIAGAVMAPGTIDLEQNRQVVQHPQGGVVADILVRDGDAVRQGDVLIRLDVVQQGTDLAYAQQRLFELRAQQARLRAVYLDAAEVDFTDELLSRAQNDVALRALLDGQHALFKAGRATIDTKSGQLRQRQEQVAARIAGLDTQIVALSEQIALVTQALETQQKLMAQGLSRAASLLQLEREGAGLRGQMGELRAAQAQARESVIEMDIEIAQLAAQRRQDAIGKSGELEQPIRKLRNDINRLQTEIVLAQVRAPVSGIVHQMEVQTPRAVLRAADPLLYLIPQHQPRIILARVIPQHIDQVFQGQEVKLRLSALDQRRTPEVFGTVTRLSADALEDRRTGQAYFEAQIRLNPGEIDKLPEDVALLPGMPVETYIQTGARSPIAYLVKPVADYFNRAFRES
ncbi:MAG: HlyD family type I secretion periplasmic adaptor subunit [Sulfitobacter sp.]